LLGKKNHRELLEEIKGEEIIVWGTFRRQNLLVLVLFIIKEGELSNKQLGYWIDLIRRTGCPMLEKMFKVPI